MRTTIHLPDDLLARAKQAAADSNRTLTALIEEAVRIVLAPRAPETRLPTALPTYGDGGVQPGVDLDDTASLLNVMENRDGPC